MMFPKENITSVFINATLTDISNIKRYISWLLALAHIRSTSVCKHKGIKKKTNGAVMDLHVSKSEDLEYMMVCRITYNSPVVLNWCAVAH